MRLLLIASCCAFMTMQHCGERAAAEGSRCPVIGSFYRPNPDDTTHGYVYRLKIEAASDAGRLLQDRQRWHFQLFDRHDGRKLADSVMERTCSGRRLCRISPRNGHDEDLDSPIVELTDGLVRVSGSSAAKIILIPEFEEWSWSIGDTLGADGNARGKVVWLRISCGS